MKLSLGMLILMMFSMVSGCATTGGSEQRRYEIADSKARWLDVYWTNKRACEARGGYIIQERHESCGIRGCSAERPEVRSRYYCSR